MTCLDKKLVKEAKIQFEKDFEKEIHELGYYLRPGITKIDIYYAIRPIVIYRDDKPPNSVMKQIENILPEVYPYKDQEIFVDETYYLPFLEEHDSNLC